MSERYVVDSVTGYPISAADNGGGRERTFWYVYDSAFCYRQVYRTYGPSEEHKARKLAAKLNALQPGQRMSQRQMDDRREWADRTA